MAALPVPNTALAAYYPAFGGTTVYGLPVIIGTTRRDYSYANGKPVAILLDGWLKVDVNVIPSTRQTSRIITQARHGQSEGGQTDADDIVVATDQCPLQLPDGPTCGNSGPKTACQAHYRCG